MNEKRSPILVLIDDVLRAVTEGGETTGNHQVVVVNSFDASGKGIDKRPVVVCSDRSSSNELRT